MESFDGKYDEPTMLLQRPSLSRSQDVSHVIASVFRDLTRETVGEQTVKNLTVSRSGDEGYHEDYVERLATIQTERQRQLDELAMLETHIMQARAAATAAEEQELQRAAEEYSECDYESLGLPPVKSHLRYCMDNELLKRFHLITPDDYIPTQPHTTNPPRGGSVPSYARYTTSSIMRYNKDHVPDNYMDDDAETQIYSQLDSDPYVTQFPEKMSSVSKPKSVTCKSKLSWRESIRPDERQRERTELQKLNAKAEYLRNPRNVAPAYPTLIKTNKKVSQKPLTTKESATSETCFKSSDILVPSPSPVIFDVYDIGEVYEIKLQLKNVSSAMRQIRVIPPATKFFSIGLGQYPGEHGMVAPGMSCQFAVKFAPHSLMDYQDKIQIRTQLDDVLEVSLLGKRKPPELTLSEVLDLGFCLVGGKKNITLNCLNFGGPGRFCFVEESKWPTTSCEWTMDNPGFVELEPFCLKPAIFELLEGHEMSLQLTFQPQSAKFYKHKVFLVCDNCQVKQFTIQGVGQTGRVEFTCVDGGLSQSLIGESRDASASYLVRFDDQNPYTSAIKKLLVKNISNVALPFHWKVTKPNMSVCEARADATRQQPVDKDSVFRLYPDNGVFQPESSFEFKIQCSPAQIGNFNGVGHLVLENVPVLASNKDIDEVVEDVTSMKVELKVMSKPFQLLVSPPVMILPGKLLVGKLYQYKIKIKNNSVSEARFEWQTSDDDMIVVLPHTGTLDADQEETLDVKICGKQRGLFESTVYCHVMYSTEPIYVHIRTEFEGPQVKVDNADVDFSLVRLGDSATRTLLLTNSSEVAACWSLRENSCYHLVDIDEGFKEMSSEFQFIPDSGTLPPFGKVDVDVVFTPLTCRRVRSISECIIDNGPSSFIRVTAEVQTPKICLLSSIIALEEVYLNVPWAKRVEIENTTLLETKFRWNECIGGDSEHCTVRFEPSEGILGPRERKLIMVTLTCSKQGALQDLVTTCTAEGMQEFVYLTFQGTIRGLEVAFRTEPDQARDERNNDAEDDLFLNFGTTTTGETSRTLLLISNTSAMRTMFHVEVEHFHAGRTPTPPSGGTPHRKTRGQAMLTKTPNISDPLSKTPSKAHADYCRSLLRDGRGAAFVCSPSCGELQPFQEQVIEVTAYSDLWGEYKDHVICKIDGLEEKRIPLFVNVEGCPLNFQMTKDKLPVVRFGTHVSGAPSVERVLRVNNNSACDIRVDWEVYNEQQDDSQLIDLIVDVGNPFPKLLKGKEVGSSQDDTQLIAVDVRKHTGTRSDSPFSVNPSQQIVPARKHSDIKVTFDPFSTKTTSVSCSSFVLGFINLDDSKEVHSEHVKRCIGRDKDPFRFNLTAGIKPAVLSIETDEDECSRFETCASDLLRLSSEGSVEVIKEIYKKRHFTLRNTTQANVSFSLVVDKPFCVVDMSAPPSACQDKSQERNSRVITLKPRKNIQVTVGFCLSSELLSRHHDSELVTDAREHGLLPALEIQKNLEIQFLNKNSQTLPLFAHISLPYLLLAKETVQFGVCLIGQPKQIMVQLTNYGKSCSQWFVEKDPQYPKESREVFSCSPEEGFVEGHLNHISYNSTQLKLTFMPRYNVNYECLLIFKGLLHEPPRSLLLCGCGSFDGAHEEVASTNT